MHQCEYEVVRGGNARTQWGGLNVRTPLRNAHLLLALGTLAVAAPVTARFYEQRVHDQDVEDIRQLRETLDATRAALATAPTATDSARLADAIRSREYYANNRQDHVLERQRRLRAWWRPTGSAGLSVAFGLVLLVIGSASVARARSRSG